jgi:hypothetical protein
MDWSRIADWSATAITVITIGARQQYLKGKHSQKFKDLEDKVNAVRDKIDAHDNRLGDGAVAFGRIDEKLDALKEGMIRIENAVQRHLDGGGK